MKLIIKYQFAEKGSERNIELRNLEIVKKYIINNNCNLTENFKINIAELTRRALILTDKYGVKHEMPVAQIPFYTL